MVHWTDEERTVIASVWSKVNKEQDGHDAVTSFLTAYSWTTKHFRSSNNLSDPIANSGNAEVSAHGKEIMALIGDAINNLDNMKSILHNHCDTHAFKLLVDPEKFRRFSEVMNNVIAAKLGSAFTPPVQHAMKKFFATLVDDLRQLPQRN